MAEAIHVSGPTTISCDLTTGGTFFVIGRTQDDDPPSFDIQTFNRIVKANDTGDAPAEIVHTGKLIVITATLVKFDEDEIGELIARPSADTEGKASTIGDLWVADIANGVGAFQTRITPTRSGQKVITFPRCYIDGAGGIRELQFGNMEKQIAIQIYAISDGTNHYTFTTPT